MDPQEREVDELRRRNVPLRKNSDADARRAVLQLNALEEKTADVETRKTFGRTPDGTVFTVPVTHDMVSQLLSPTEPKNVSDALVLLVLILHFLLFRTLPSSWRVFILGAVFLVWRAGYNIGIGWLLLKQSRQLTLIRWAKKSTLFGTAEACTHPRLRAFVKRELETKIPKDYDFDTAPLEYNTWLVFRRIVDLILMCDFTSYVLFAVACGHKPVNESAAITIARWSVGIILFIFNLWVKLDAHRVVKDYAWYWGDFFYLVDQELTFDGVFEMAPHPMYSIGYVGYYGISLMAASYKVLFVSIIAHAAQFAFLVWVENPHIERTYNSPPPRRQINDEPKATTDRPAVARQGTAAVWPNPSSDKPSATHNLLGIQNLDLYRTTDSSLMVMVGLFICLTLSSPNTPAYRALFIVNAVIWRLWFSIGIGYLLNRQSVKKKWTRHFLKFGESLGEAWRQWKGTYHMSMVLCYISFAAAAWKVYAVPVDWDYGLVLFKHVIGFSLIALQIWVSFSIYDSLGEFGWFFGDFFFDHSPKLTYGGIYRFLNNPERVLGLAGVWGVALITSNKAIFGLALFSHTLSLAFIQFVERPHMQKLYGRNLRQDAGLVRSLRRSLPPPLRQWQDGMDRVLDETFDIIEDFLDAARPKLAASVNTLVHDTKDFLRKYPSRVPLTRGNSGSIDLDPRNYSIEIEGEQMLSTQASLHPIAETERNLSIRTGEGSTALVFEYGAPIKVRWTAPVNHGKSDWIGLYKVADHESRQVTLIASAGRWIATNHGEYDTQSAEIGLVQSEERVIKQTESGAEEEYVSGEMIFSGTKLWWIQGSFEFRYHHNGKHRVMAISLPFEVRISKFTEDDLDLSLSNQNPGQSLSSTDAMIRHAIEQILLPIVQNCFDRDPDIAPRTALETFGGLVERDGRFARRVVYAIQHIFGIEFAPAVVKADGKVQNLAWRIWEAKKVLAPYSMTHSRGDSTPAEDQSKDE